MCNNKHCVKFHKFIVKTAEICYTYTYFYAESYLQEGGFHFMNSDRSKASEQIKKISAISAAVLICAGILSGCTDSSAPVNSPDISVSDSSSADLSDAVESASAQDLTASDDGAVLSLPSGFYNEPVTLQMTCTDANAKIYYTTDGSVPDETDTLYTSPLILNDRSAEPNVLSAKTGTSAGGDYIPRKNVDKANVIRAVAVYPDGTKSEVSNGTYFIGIDRENKYGSVPVISLTTEMENLYDYEKGIYILGKAFDEWKAEQTGHYEPWQAVGNYSGRGREWERPVTVELITADGSEGFTQDMGIRIMGAASRNATQKSFRITAREDYGKKALEYELIPDNLRSDGTGNVTKYKSFVLRNGGNDCDYAKIRDPLFQHLVSDRRFDTMQTTPCVVYLNGEYWGMYTIAEDYSDNYIENNYGIDNKNVVIVKKGEIESGEDSDIELYHELYDFITENDMIVAENYEQACSMLDMGSFIDSCALNLYINNEDSMFKNNNWQMWRVRTPDDSSEYADGKWRMLIYDTDYSAGIYDGGRYDTDNISKAIKPVLDNSGSENAEEKSYNPSDIFIALYRNPDFRRELITVMCDMRNVNFKSSHAIEEMVKMMEVYSQLVPDTFKRFGPDWIARQRTDEYYTQKMNELANFLDGRYSVFTEIMQESFGLGDIANVSVVISDSTKGTVIMNTVKLPDEFSGKYFTDYPVTVTAVPSDGCTFAGWECEGAEISDSTSTTAEITFSGDFTLRAVFE